MNSKLHILVLKARACDRLHERRGRPSSPPRRLGACRRSRTNGSSARRSITACRASPSAPLSGLRPGRLSIFMCPIAGSDGAGPTRIDCKARVMPRFCPSAGCARHAQRLHTFLADALSPAPEAARADGCFGLQVHLTADRPPARIPKVHPLFTDKSQMQIQKTFHKLLFFHQLLPARILSDNIQKVMPRIKLN